MKKLFALLVVAGMTFFACGSSENTEEVATEGEGMEVVAEETTNEDATVAAEETAEETVAEETAETPAE